MQDTFKVEFLLAWNDGTWTTEFYEVPIRLDFSSDEELNEWWQNEHIHSEPKYENLVLVTVYSKVNGYED